MKSTLKLAKSIVIAFVCTATAYGAEYPAEGPKGGKLLDNEPPRAEFVVEQDNRVIIHFYDASLQPVPAAEQIAVVWADAKGGRKKLELAKKDGLLVSAEPLPEGEYRVKVQIKAKPDAKFQNFDINFSKETCSDCKRVEYACICPAGKSHGHGEKEHKKGDGHQH